MNEAFKGGHPSPDKYREKWICLNGEWEFSFDNPIYDRKILVPFSWTCPLSGIEEPDKKGSGYYRKNVSYDKGNNRLFLIIGGADYECEVFVNGIFAAKHFGGYSEFEVELSGFWHNYSENEIVVKVTDFDNDYQTYGKQGYGNIRGIWQDIYLEERPKSYINKFRFTTQIDGTVKVNAEITGDFDKFSAESENIVAESKNGSISFKIEKPLLWSPDSPYLYECTLRLYSGGDVDAVKTYFGVREIGTAKINNIQYITLNKKPVYINAALDQSFNPKGFFTLPNEKYAKEEIERAKHLGLNAIRIHIKAEEKRKLYWADKLGMMIIEDIPCFWGNPDKAARQYFEKQMYEIIDRDINHPSVIYWVLFNETWGLKTYKGEVNPSSKDWEYTKETQEWVRKLWNDVKRYDSTRLVEDNSPCNRDHVETDVNTWHFYINGYDRIKKECERIDREFVEGSKENYIRDNMMTDIPVMNSECGNYWGTVGNSGDSDISWHYKYMINEFRLHEKINGFVFTELKDVINEFNGYYRIDDSPKDFGYCGYVEDMTVKDLHSSDYLGYDLQPMSAYSPGETVSIPIFISSFSDRFHGKLMKVKWEAVFTDGIGNAAAADRDELAIRYNKYGVTNVGEISLKLPAKDGIVNVKLYLCDDFNNIIMRNFVLFDVIGKQGAKAEVALDKIKCKGFKRAWLVQGGNKLNCTGAGQLKFDIHKKDIQGGSIYMELSSKEELTKDKLNRNIDTGKIDLDFMRGYTVDRGENPNSFYMTDDERFESNIKIFANEHFISELTLEDDPADSRGCLSWLYQKQDDYLDEAGSYGYLCKIHIGDDILKKLPDKFSITIAVDNGISVFGRKSGRYPVGIGIGVYYG